MTDRKCKAPDGKICVRCICGRGKINLSSSPAAYILARAKAVETGEKIKFAPGWYVSATKDDLE